MKNTSAINCCECGEPLTVFMEKYRGYCMWCYDTSKKLFNGVHQLGLLWETVEEYIINDWITEDCISSLHKIPRDKICDMIEEEWRNIENANKNIGQNKNI